MPAFDYDIGIIGGGAAGLTVAAGASQLGAKTLLVEKEPKLGGDCLHYGCVPSKTLIKSACVYHILKNTKQYGLPEVNVPSVDFKQVRTRIESVINIIQKHDSAERFCKLGTKVESGHASFVDEHVIQINGKKLSAAKWVIASGSTASTPPVEGLAQTPYLTNKEIFYLDHLPASMIIIGGGPIAIEMAQAFNRLGTKVHVIQRSGQILRKEDKDMADQVMKVLADEGVKFHVNTSLVSTKDLGNRKELLYKNQAGELMNIQAEALFVALGRAPTVSDMGLETIGLEFDRKGIKVDNRLRTNHKHIFAAGDVNGAYPFTHTAGYEGGIVISNAIFRLPRKTNYTLIPSSMYTDPELASIGMNEKAAREAGLDYSVWTEEFKDNDRSLAEGVDTGTIKLLLNKKEKPIGIQIFGPHAGELLNEWVAVMNGRIGLATMASAVHPYPTLGEINKRVAGAYLSKKLFSEKVRKALTFFFNLKGRACAIKE